MKMITTSICAIMLALLSMSALAEKVTITGTPVIVEKQGDYYVPASSTTFTTTQDYYYVAYDNNNMVCYRDVQPALASVDGGIFAFKLGTDTVQVHCYKYSPDYFMVQ